MVFNVLHSWKVSFFDMNLVKFFHKMLPLLSFVRQKASRTPQDLSKLAFLNHFGPKLNPRWLQDAASWRQVAAKLAPSWLKLRPSWAKICSRSAQGPLPDAPGRVLGEPWGSLMAKMRLRRPQGCENGFKSCQNDPKLMQKVPNLTKS